MKPSFCLLIPFFISSVLSTLTIRHLPLIYDYDTLKVYNLESNSPDTSPKYPYAVACPATGPIEEKLNKGYALDGKALFVRRHFKKQDVFSVPTKECSTSIELAVVLLRGGKENEIEFGYEIYARSGTLPIDAFKSLYRGYGGISEAGGFFKRFVSALAYVDYPALGEEPVGFIWITKFSTTYDVSSWNVIEIKYEIYRNAYQVNVDCQDYNLGEKLYQDEDFYKFYSWDRQEKIFSSVKLPERVGGDSLDTIYEHAKRYNLLLPYNYQPTNSSPVSCSNLTTIPIWYRKTEALLNYLEHFLIAIGQISENPLKILAGVQDVITLPPSNNRKRNPIRIFLDSEKKRIPIPKIIYKVVKYQSHECDSLKELCMFSIAIIIHNHPNVRKTDKLCLKDKCREWGWDNIQYMDTGKKGEKSNHIYCCRFDNELRKTLGYRKDQRKYEELNLKDFPRYEDSIEDFEYTDKQKEFEDQMNQLILQSKFSPYLNPESTAGFSRPKVE